MEDKDPSEVSIIIVPTYYLRKLSRPQTRRENQAKLDGLSELPNRTATSGEHKIEWAEKRAREVSEMPFRVFS